MLPLHLRGQDTVAEFEAAATQRFNEAERLGQRSHHLGAVYLFGYSVEMRVKALFFRNAGFATKQVITRQDRTDAADMYATLGLLTRPGQHDVSGWAALAVASRATTAAPYSVGAGGLGTEIVNRATALYLIWRETLRYRSVAATGAEFREVRRVAAWFGSNYGRML